MQRWRQSMTSLRGSLATAAQIPAQTPMKSGWLLCVWQYGGDGVREMHARAVPAKLPLLSRNSRAQIHSPSPSSPRSLVMSRLHYRRPSLRVPSLSAKCFACSPTRSLVPLRGNSRDQVVTSPARNEGWSWSCFENAPPRMFASIERATLMFSRLWDERSWLDDFRHAKGDRWEFSGHVFQDLLHVSE